MKFVVVFVIFIYREGKDKACPRTGREGPEGEQRYRFTLSLALALDEVGG